MMEDNTCRHFFIRVFISLSNKVHDHKSYDLLDLLSRVPRVLNNDSSFPSVLIEVVITPLHVTLLLKKIILIFHFIFFNNNKKKKTAILY